MKLLLELTKKLKPYGQDPFLLALSGGLDSMALFYIFLHFRKHFNFDFAVAHFHHGPSDNIDQQNFRWQAYEFVKAQCQRQEVPFFSNVAETTQSEFLQNFSPKLISENDFRKARYGFFNQLLPSEQKKYLVLAHHQDDLLETRLLRLLRGTGPEGLWAMKFESGDLLRPLLEYSRDELSEFLKSKQGEFVEDPSNQDTGYLRNWLRHSWLKELEEHYPKAKQNLSRSLDLLVSSLDQSEQLSSLSSQDSLNLSELLCLSPQQKAQVVASYMKSQGLKNYGLSHVNEIIKRLDREEKSHTFRLLGCSWKVDAGRMSLQKSH